MFRLVSLALLAISSQAIKINQVKTLAEVSQSGPRIPENPPTPEEAHEWFDTNGDKKITLEEFLTKLKWLCENKWNYQYTQDDI